MDMSQIKIAQAAFCPLHLYIYVAWQMSTGRLVVGMDYVDQWPLVLFWPVQTNLTLKYETASHSWWMHTSLSGNNCYQDMMHWILNTACMRRCFWGKNVITMLTACNIHLVGFCLCSRVPKAHDCMQCIANWSVMPLKGENKIIFSTGAIHNPPQPRLCIQINLKTVWLLFLDLFWDS